MMAGVFIERRVIHIHQIQGVGAWFRVQQKNGFHAADLSGIQKLPDRAVVAIVTNLLANGKLPLLFGGKIDKPHRLFKVIRDGFGHEDVQAGFQGLFTLFKMKFRPSLPVTIRFS